MQDGNSNQTPKAVTKRRALGRGLDALIPQIDPIESSEKKEFFECHTDLIAPNRFQMRLRFSENELEELSCSIRTQGIIQPLIVRPSNSGYELVAGERRLRAAKMAGLDRVPVIIKEISDQELLEMSIIENIQREDLNPLEEAEAYHRLMNELNLSQEDTARRVGKSRSAVANFLRLRRLPDDIKETIIDGTLSMGHARALLGADNPAQQHEVWHAVVSKGLSVRETENLVKRLKTIMPPVPVPEPDAETLHFKDIEENLSRHFGTRVAIHRKGKKGRVVIEFYNDKDLDRLIRLLRT